MQNIIQTKSLKKNVVYNIICSACGTVYIGETGRTIGSRVKEHLTMRKQTVYKHLESHNKCKIPQITWSILHANIGNHEERKYVEALEIQKHSGHLMNGCIVGGQLAYIGFNKLVFRIV